MPVVRRVNCLFVAARTDENPVCETTTRPDSALPDCARQPADEDRDSQPSHQESSELPVTHPFQSTYFLDRPTLDLLKLSTTKAIFTVRRKSGISIMTILSTLTRSSTARASRTIYRQAAVASYSGPAVDYDHFTHGWNVKDIDDFTVDGKYSMQTFNKISPKVSPVLYFSFVLGSADSVLCMTYAMYCSRSYGICFISSNPRL